MFENNFLLKKKVKYYNKNDSLMGMKKIERIISRVWERVRGGEHSTLSSFVRELSDKIQKTLSDRTAPHVGPLFFYYFFI